MIERNTEGQKNTWPDMVAVRADSGKFLPSPKIILPRISPQKTRFCEKSSFALFLCIDTKQKADKISTTTRGQRKQGNDK